MHAYICTHTHTHTYSFWNNVLCSLECMEEKPWLLVKSIWNVLKICGQTVKKCQGLLKNNMGSWKHRKQKWWYQMKHYAQLLTLMEASAKNRFYGWHRERSTLSLSRNWSINREPKYIRTAHCPLCRGERRYQKHLLWQGLSVPWLLTYKGDDKDISLAPLSINFHSCYIIFLF